MASPHPPEAETLLPPGAIVDPATARSSVADSLGVPHSNYDGVRESQYSSVPLNQSYDPYADAATPSPRGTTPSQYLQDDSAAKLEKDYGDAPQSKKSPWIKILAGLLLLILIVIAVLVPVYFKVIKPNNNAVESNSGSGGSGTSSGTAPEATQSSTPQIAITGGDGSTVTTETGKFVYNNSFGGFWYYDTKDPFKNYAQAQSWSPPLNTTWKWGQDQIRGYVARLCIPRASDGFL